MKIKEIVYALLLFIISILFIFSLFNFIDSLLVAKYEIIVTNKNRIEINEMLKEFCDNPNKINVIRFKVELGDGELRLYNYFHLEKKVQVSQMDKIMDYMCENGKPLKEICLFEMFIEVITFLCLNRIRIVTRRNCDE